ncbi:MAG: PD40 domain-containing protein [Candidatus Eisenbacteria bacterium]|nr:PD40 domain-containing protein [Candidatus Eisenbacteria bacterium]MCC7142570.1 PD40 domain-containing protein [Candidatus Eisenbacteria bacterium]
MKALRTAWVLIVLASIVACGGEDPVRSRGDESPPSAVTDLAVTVIEPSDALLFWTAPGDDGMAGQAAAYELRHFDTVITETNWDSASVVDSLPLPHSAGWRENLRITDVDYGHRFFALRTRDEVNNLSALSNVPGGEWVDETPPSAVMDLEARFGQDGEILLDWTAPGGDGTQGRAARYELRKALAPITEETWEAATILPDPPTPALAGTRETMRITGQPKHQWIYIAIRAGDHAPNWSALSNQPRGALGFTRLLAESVDLRFPGHARWSPDGRQIAFDARDESGRSGVFVVDPSIGLPVRVTPPEASAYFPAWAPTGVSIAWSGLLSSAHGSSPGLWQVEPVPGTTPDPLCSVVEEVYQLDWSPDGTRLAVGAGDWPFTTIQSWIFTVPLGGDRLTRLTSEFFVDEWSPRFSPDGAWILFSSSRPSDAGVHLWRVPAEGGAPTQLVVGAHSQYTPAWSRDGRYIAYSSKRGANGNLWRVAADGSDPVQLTFGAAADRDPDWSPDGQRIVFTSEGSGNTELWLMTLEE